MKMVWRKAFLFVAEATALHFLKTSEHNPHLTTGEESPILSITHNTSRARHSLPIIVIKSGIITINAEFL
jgi:hypothetical protein